VPGHSALDVGLRLRRTAPGTGGSTPNGITSTLVRHASDSGGPGCPLASRPAINIGGRASSSWRGRAMTVATTVGTSQSIHRHPLALLAGRCSGAAGHPGFLKATSGAHELWTTIMLNYVFVSVTYWPSGPLALPNAHQPITADVRLGTRPADHHSIRPRRPPRHPAGSAGGSGPVVLLYRTTLGFEIRAAAPTGRARYGG